MRTMVFVVRAQVCRISVVSMCQLMIESERGIKLKCER